MIKYCENLPLSKNRKVYEVITTYIAQIRHSQTENAVFVISVKYLKRKQRLSVVFYIPVGGPLMNLDSYTVTKISHSDQVQNFQIDYLFGEDNSDFKCRMELTQLHETDTKNV